MRARRLVPAFLGVCMSLVITATPAAAVRAPLTDGFTSPSAPGAVAVQVGTDVSYPQCGRVLPAPGALGIVGVDGGKPFDANPCLAEQIAWARLAGRPVYYANTANPGAPLSSHWPVGRSWPRRCTRAATDSPGCAFDYGWIAAADSLRRARVAAVQAGAASPTRSTWWLDVEVHNTWEALVHGPRPRLLANDTAVLAGMTAYLRRQGVRRVGVYSTTEQWFRITGGATLDKAPVWYAGAGPLAAARSHCSPDHSFTGGPVRLAQFIKNGLDADLVC